MTGISQNSNFSVFNVIRLSFLLPLAVVVPIGASVPSILRTGAEALQILFIIPLCVF